MAVLKFVLPGRPTPIQPRTGHKMTNAGPILDSPNASELAIPVNTNVYASPKRKKPTSSAPHSGRNVFRNTSCNSAPVGRQNNKITSHETKMEVPPLSGVKLNVEAAALCVTDEIALTLHLCRLSPGRFT